ncbi:hypothetical protein TNCV_4506631 [Trichonephila clavipes]|nr:hypothetical protein TNCV_4506631 [Trichonephila clavipes]
MFCVAFGGVEGESSLDKQSWQNRFSFRVQRKEIHVYPILLELESRLTNCQEQHELNVKSVFLPRMLPKAVVFGCEVKVASQESLREVAKNGFQKSYEGWQTCIVAQGLWRWMCFGAGNYSG